MVGYFPGHEVFGACDFGLAISADRRVRGLNTVDNVVNTSFFLALRENVSHEKLDGDFFFGQTTVVAFGSENTLSGT